MQKNKRIIAFDAMRALAMIAGVFFHGALAYMTTKTEWALFDIKTNVAFDLFTWGLHRVRIPIFFIISGYLSKISYELKGHQGFLKVRFKKIFIPFALSYLIIVPFIMSMVVRIRNSSCSENTSFDCLVNISWPYSVTNVFTSETLHLWFLYFLFLYQVLFYLIKKLKIRKISFEKLNISLAVALLISQCLMKSWTTTNTSSELIIDPVSFVYYGIFFLWGTQLFYQDIETLFSKFLTKRNFLMLVTLFIMTPLFFLLKKNNPNASYLFYLTPFVSLLSVLFSILSILVLFAAGLKFFKTIPKSLAYLLDASYWIYLWHIIPLIVFQSYINNLDFFILGKFLFVTLLSLIVLILFYHSCVRYTFIGTFLHGKRSRRSINL